MEKNQDAKLEQKMKELEQELKRKIQNIIQKPKIGIKEEKKEEKKQGNKNKEEEFIPIIEPIQTIDIKSAFKEKFKIDGPVIQFKDQFDGKDYQLLGSLPISHKKINKFTIEKTQGGYIYLGIISEQYIGDRNSLS